VEVIIVDDLPFMRFLLRSAVEEAGYRVAAEAGDGRHALREYLRNPGSLVFMDINMPVLDGISALEHILRHDPEARIIMCSTIDEEDMIIRALNLGARDYIVKPFSARRVEDALRRAEMPV
jgi:two-component system chemotaxis response regulator CheY